MFNSTMSLHLVYTSYDRVTKQHCVVAHRERERESDVVNNGVNYVKS